MSSRSPLRKIEISGRVNPIVARKADQQHPVHRIFAGYRRCPPTRCGWPQQPDAFVIANGRGVQARAPQRALQSSYCLGPVRHNRLALKSASLLAS